jgi:hypothetical protein
MKICGGEALARPAESAQVLGSLYFRGRIGDRLYYSVSAKELPATPSVAEFDAG